MKIDTSALIFPGQGSQKIGMGKDLYDNYAVAKDVFLRVDDALEFKLSEIIFGENQDELNLTSNAQPAIMTTSIAYFEVLKKLEIIDIDNVKFMAGHSLGEYSALCAAGVLTLEDTAKLLKLRGQYMMQACIENKGSMAALIGADYDLAKRIADDCNCFVGNSNSPAQIVLSGDTSSIEKACDVAKAQGVKRAVILPVSGAFHSPLMQSASDKMLDVINNTKFAMPDINVISNLTANEYTNSDEIKDLLVKQITNTVKWQESICYINKKGANKFIEVGFGNVLSGLVKKTLEDAIIETSEDLLKNYNEAI
ncbi:MAG: ACP S-malonyltransferase [Alphaproteobacteria bacterium]|nr:ACP S-malonyltransferase [Alphaproteobacteria bacterium]